MIIWGQNPLTFMISISSTTVLYDKMQSVPFCIIYVKKIQTVVITEKMCSKKVQKLKKKFSSGSDWTHSLHGFDRNVQQLFTVFSLLPRSQSLKGISSIVITAIWNIEYIDKIFPFTHVYFRILICHLIFLAYSVFAYLFVACYFLVLFSSLPLKTLLDRDLQYCGSQQPAYAGELYRNPI